jgi:ribosomal protein L7/L12
MTALLPYFAVALLVLIWFRVERTAWHISELQEQLAKLRRDLGLALQLSTEPSEQVHNLAANSAKTIEAIKTYRMESGADLKTAREVVEQLRNPRGGV